jgi:glycosyltransferase involved in cell wall biosynthesis
MNIAYISNSLIPSDKANSINVMKMAESFSNHGHSVILFGHKNKSIHDKKGKIYQRYGVKNVFKLVLWNYQLKKFNNTLFALYSLFVNCHIFKPKLIYTRNIVIACIYKVFKYRVFLELHSDHFRNIDKYMLKYCLKGNYPLQLIFISRRLKEIVSGLFIFSHNYLILHDGVNTKLYSEYSMPMLKKNISIVYTGSLYKGRGLDVVLEAMSKMSVPLNVTLSIYGGPKSEIEKYRHANTLSRIYFHEYVDNMFIPKILKECDIVLMPYQDDTQTSGGRVSTDYMSPMKMFEYMASGSIIVASKIPVLSEVLNENNACLVDDYNNPNSWSIMIQDVIHNPIISEKKARYAYHDSKKYSWDSRTYSILSKYNMDGN